MMISNVVKGEYCTLGSTKLNNILRGMSTKNIVDANSTIMKLRTDLEEVNFDFNKLWQGNYKIVITDNKDFIVCNLASKCVSFVNEDGFEILFEAEDQILQELENDLYEMYFNKENGIKLFMKTFHAKGMFKEDVAWKERYGKDEYNIFGCREAKNADEKMKLNLIDKSNKLILDKITFKKHEDEIMKMINQLDDLYMNVYNNQDKLDDQKILNYVNRLSDLRQKMEKYIKLCRSMQKSIDRKLEDYKLKMNS